MEIFINGEKISYTLQEEKSLFDIFSSIKKSITDAHAIITALFVNKKAVELDEQYLQSITLENIEHIDIEARSVVELHVERVETMQNYIETIKKIAEHAKSGNAKKASDYNIHVEDIHVIAENMDTVCKSEYFEYTAMRHVFMYACTMLGLLKENEEEVTASEEAIDLLEIVSVFLKPYIFVAEVAPVAAARSNEHMIESIPKIISLSHRFISGNEQCALHYFIASTDFILNWLIICFNIRDDEPGGAEGPIAEAWHKSHDAFNKSFEEFWKDIGTALKANDFVSVNDLMEYEVAPKVEEYATAMKAYY